MVAAAGDSISKVAMPGFHEFDLMLDYDPFALRWRPSLWRARTLHGKAPRSRFTPPFRTMAG